MSKRWLTRRDFCGRLLAGAGAATLASGAACAGESPFALHYILASCMYGEMDLADILPEVQRSGAQHIDIWPKPHGNQREQIEAMGRDAFAALLEKHRVSLGILTHYDLGPFALQKEMRFARQLGGTMLVCGGSGPARLKGAELKAAVRHFAEEMKPHIAAAEEHGVAIAIENHANNLIESPDAMRWLVEFAPSKHIGIALAPYHLPQDPAQLAGLIQELGDRLLHFYAWQHGLGCHEARPKEEELLQMPGRGPLDFKPLLAALKRIGYRGWTQPFMHPVPRGIPILNTAAEVTAEINRARAHLEGCLAELQQDNRNGNGPTASS